MLKLFESTPFPTAGSIHSSQYPLLRSMGDNIYQTLVGYFHRSGFRLPNNHLLVQLLKNLEFSLETPFEKVVETVYSRAPYVSRHFNLTTQTSYGKSHRSVFYSSSSNDVHDFILSSNIADVDPFVPRFTWNRLSPIRVLHHPGTDFKWLPINGEISTKWSGYSVTHVDVPLLALQYRDFCEEMRLQYQGDEVYNPNRFIAQRILPKIYKSHMDYTLVNLFRQREGLIPIEKPTQWLPISIPDLEVQANNTVKEIHKKLSNTRRLYIQSLESFPSMFSKNGRDTLVMPDYVPVRQLKWLEIIARLPVIETLISLQGKPGREANTSYLSQFKLDAQRFMVAKEYIYIPERIRQPILDSIERIQNY